MNSKLKSLIIRFTGVVVILGITGCPSNEYQHLLQKAQKQPITTDPSAYNYLVGPGDSQNIFVWRNPEVSQTVIVRPDGKVTTPNSLFRDIQLLRVSCG